LVRKDSTTTIGRIQTRKLEDVDYDERRVCTRCSNLIEDESGSYVCQCGNLPHGYSSLESLKGPLPREVAASCRNYQKK